MQEGTLALMQMATVSQAIAALREAGLLTVSLITDPTFGGVAASFATNADVIVAETGARMGFAGPRVIRQTLRQALPEGFQTAEFLLRHGQIDMIVDRRNLRAHLQPLFAAACGPPTPAVRRRPTEPRRRTRPVLVGDPDRLAPRGRLAHRAGRPGTPAARPRWTISARPSTVSSSCTATGSAPTARPSSPDWPGSATGRWPWWGTRRGTTPSELLARNFGMSTPAGYRKALRVMRLAAKLGLPVVTLIDTPGAYPGVEAEQHGQAAAIAENILAMTGLPVPIVAVVTGEGGSGGALALGVADRVLMLENAVYSVISPEGCAAILWNDPAAAPRAAEALRITAPELLPVWASSTGWCRSRRTARTGPRPPPPTCCAGRSWRPWRRSSGCPRTNWCTSAGGASAATAPPVAPAGTADGPGIGRRAAPAGAGQRPAVAGAR